MVNQPPPYPSRLRRPTWGAIRAVLLASTLITTVTIGARQLGILQPLELAGFDQFVRSQPDEPPDPRLLIVGITEDDIRSRKEYPLTDQTVLQLLEKLEKHEPQAIGLDIIRDVPIGSGRAALLEHMQQSDHLVAVCKVGDQNAPGFPPPEGLDLDQIGSANLGVDPDGILRRALLTLVPLQSQNSSATPASLCDDPNETIPYFGLQLALRYLEARGIEMKLTDRDENIQLDSVVFQPLQRNVGPYRSADVAQDQGYPLLIRYRAVRQVATEVSLADLLQDKVDPNQIKDRIVLVGYVARSVKDEVNTPYGHKQNMPPMPGVVAHAQVVSQILSAVLDDRSLFWFWQSWMEDLWVWGWALAGGVLAWWIRRPWLLLLALTGSLTTLGVIGYGLFLQAGWIPLFPPAFAFLLTAGSIILFTRGVVQAIYEGVKGFLKLDIEIDVAKKEREVAEIIESDYFQQLQTKSEKLRQQKTDPTASQTILPDPQMSPARSHRPIVTIIQTEGNDLQSSAANEADALIERVQSKRQQMQRSQTTSTPTTSLQADRDITAIPAQNLNPYHQVDQPLETPILESQVPTIESITNPVENKQPSSQPSLDQLLQEVDEYYQQLKNHKQTKS
jgi:adenylate cyclase